jgi:hypothetical protein
MGGRQVRAAKRARGIVKKEEYCIAQRMPVPTPACNSARPRNAAEAYNLALQ